jgi:pimeloyl-ACP methyl ester carboxylesterase
VKRTTGLVRGLVVVAVLQGCGSFGPEGTDSASSDSADSDSSILGVTAEALVHGDSSAGKRRPLAVECEQLVASLALPNTVFSSATSVAEGALQQGGQPIPAHCLLVGRMFERVGPLDGQAYAIGFEMRLPTRWNRRFFYQANGGLDGAVAPALGSGSGGGPLTGALLQGFAVLSSDAGHSASQNPYFGLDPQARLDFGYQAIAKLTPMAKKVIRTAYGAKPAYSYIGGCSNGGRHAMVAAARYPDQYDGYLVGAPGFNLPKAAVASIYGAQQYAPLTGGAVIPGGPFAGLPDLSAAFTQPERQLLSNKVLERCDALDGVVDGMVHRTTDCQSIFDLDADVPTCPGPRDGSCLSAAQKVAIGNIFAGGETTAGEPIYSSFPFDTGYTAGDANFWEFVSPLILDPGAVGFVFGTPPANPATFIPPLFALTGSIDQMHASLFATSAPYNESAQSFMVPPDLDSLSGLRKHKARMIVYHGVSDPIFSADDTVRWFEDLNGRVADSHARLFLVPGMSHCGNGPATDQFDLLTPLVRWVEQNKAPSRVIASVRGPTNPGGPNFELPAGWSTDRTRPLCAYPRVASYCGGDIERADSFDCKR